MYDMVKVVKSLIILFNIFNLRMQKETLENVEVNGLKTISPRIFEILLIDFK